MRYQTVGAFLLGMCSAFAGAQTPPAALPDVLPPPTPLPAPPGPVEAPAIAPTPCPPPMCDKTYTGLKVHLVEEQTLEERPAAALHEVIARIPTCDLQVDYREEKRTATVMVLKPREEEQPVTVMTLAPETVIDPCTGCAHTEYKQVPVCKTVKVTVYDRVPETRTYTVKVPVLRPVPGEVQIQHYLVDLSPRPAVVSHYKAVELPADTHYQIPVCPSPGPALPSGPEEPRRPEGPEPVR